MSRGNWGLVIRREQVHDGNPIGGSLGSILALHEHIHRDVLVVEVVARALYRRIGYITHALPLRAPARLRRAIALVAVAVIGRASHSASGSCTLGGRFPLGLGSQVLGPLAAQYIIGELPERTMSGAAGCREERTGCGQ
eukprot:CAMPEP_0115738436 /NCGR_PEP_ID=MMETSP0272-20121206/88387_1 /TAXON_ID=71861 /ORGANISM="Scrippsiella trochoidea, Strain CCMP3099" /LENGTH=138 /DNA_ID=CAMNT_0003182879 /DNA_START=30 /DNA_END=446 /DNA_ORIENTATION=+